jgi:DNA modification methylase
MTVTYPTANDSLEVLKEQFRLMIFSDSGIPTVETLFVIADSLTKRERLAALLEGTLDFHGENSGYASHDLHAFAAKFPPQLPQAFIRGLTEPGDIVLDPMMGSGTTVVEALLEGRTGIGLDIDPLALRLGRVKTTPSDIDELTKAGQMVVTQASALLFESEIIEDALNSQFDAATRAFIDYWFLPTTQRELMALVLTIGRIDETVVRRFMELTFSSVIVTKSGGVSLARDLAHSRPHLDRGKVPKNAIDQFSIRLRKNLASIARLKTNGTSATPVGADARRMPFADNAIDLVVTSPPYANAIDYMRAHKFSLVWFGEKISDLSRLRAEYIGSERASRNQNTVLPVKVQQIVSSLAQRDAGKAAILRKYYAEMQMVLAETYRVLRPASAAIIVVGTSLMREIDVQTHTCLAEIAAELGFDVVGIARRALDRNKRMMPARFGRKTDSMIEQRMHEEYVIGLLKPSKT